ncbi:hypothetical protein [Corynebacterium accolens]|uniref:hypothetical protein n=1 Tax=Corynebacterium accolens TaxID=38284 RepID=UPI00266F0B40|nr:hypothetical protein [Corynebacterium accolens]WKS54927.1 hypothetical protein NLL31_06760 [Corynebacterium accolens]
MNTNNGIKFTRNAYPWAFDPHEVIVAGLTLQDAKQWAAQHGLRNAPHIALGGHALHRARGLSGIRAVMITTRLEQCAMSLAPIEENTFSCMLGSAPVLPMHYKRTGNQEGA